MCMICLLVVQPIFMAFNLTQDSIIQIAGAAVVVVVVVAAVVVFGGQFVALNLISIYCRGT